MPEPTRGATRDAPVTASAKWLGIGAIVAMSAALGHALVHGDFTAEGAALLASPWGLATLVEAYVGFALLGGWIARRERRPIVAASWIVALLLGGNLVGGLYVLRAATTSAGDATRFWTGHASEAG